MGNKTPSKSSQIVRGDISGRGSHLPGCRYFPDKGRFDCDSQCTAGVYSLIPALIPGHIMERAYNGKYNCAWCTLRHEESSMISGAEHKCSSCVDQIYLHDKCFHAWHGHMKACHRIQAQKNIDIFLTEF